MTNRERERLKHFIRDELNQIDDELLKERLRYSLKKSEAASGETWGSLSRGTALLLLAGNHSEALPAGYAVELVHHATLVVDDIIDGAVSRRGYPSVWKKFGVRDAVLVSHHMTNHAFAVLGDAMPLSEQAGGWFSQTDVWGSLAAMATCELRALYSPIQDLDDYLHQASTKTGLLFGILPAIAAAWPTCVVNDMIAAREAWTNVGVAHQMLDDLVDSHPGQESSVFATPDDALRNQASGLYGLWNLGYPLEGLFETYENVAARAVEQVRASLNDAPQGEAIIELARLICWGPTRLRLENLNVDRSTPTT